MDWTTALERLVGRPCFDRPFVCDGLPPDATVIVVGENPATDMGADWWSFWDPSSGFDLAAFRSEYEARRRARNQRPVSPTRQRLDALRGSDLRTVETNAFRHEHPVGGRTGTSNHALLMLLIEGMPKLRAIVAHGVPARKFLAECRSIPQSVDLIEVGHLSRISKVEFDALLRRLDPCRNRLRNVASAHA